MGRGLKLPFGREQVHSMLVDLGRVGSKPTEPCVAPPFRGFSVEWMPLKGVTRSDADKRIVPAPAAGGPASALAPPVPMDVQQPAAVPQPPASQPPPFPQAPAAPALQPALS